MMNGDMRKVYLYTRYERLWHWVQMVLIAFLLLTGFEVQGLYHIFGFQTAVKLHSIAGLSWLIAFAVFIFWVFTTGEWKQYIPTTRKIFEVIRYYSLGIFKGEPHPVPKSREVKHNPLQRLTYLAMAALLLPVQMITGFLYWSYNSWPQMGLGFLSLNIVAILHIAGAFAIITFVIIHVYMTTTGHTVFAHIRAMITGWEEIEDTRHIGDWEEKTAPK